MTRFRSFFPSGQPRGSAPAFSFPFDDCSSSGRRESPEIRLRSDDLFFFPGWSVRVAPFFILPARSIPPLFACSCHGQGRHAFFMFSSPRPIFPPLSFQALRLLIVLRVVSPTFFCRFHNFLPLCCVFWMESLFPVFCFSRYFTDNHLPELRRFF